MNTDKKVISSDLLVNKQDLKDIRFVHNDLLHHGPLAADELLVKVDNFAFTSNNITYAAVGESMHYWDFFPSEEGWGRVPCWGFADVIASNHADIEPGERVYGYFPMSTHLRLRAGRVSATGFYDISDHRLALPVVYNHYIRTQADPSYQRQYEELHSLFQPLFATSFLLEDYLAEQKHFGAENLLLTSASSKTSIALAFLLKNNRKSSDTYKVTGLTSRSNIDFVKGLDLYDSVLAYGDAEKIGDGPSMIVDFAGNKKLLLELQQLLADDLVRICMVGLSHWEERSAEGHLHVEHEFFFAPAQAEKRTAEWGGAGLRDRMAASFIPFLRSSGKWLNICRGNGLGIVEKTYKDMVLGKVNPSEGWILSLHEQ